MHSQLWLLSCSVGIVSVIKSLTQDYLSSCFGGKKCYTSTLPKSCQLCRDVPDFDWLIGFHINLRNVSQPLLWKSWFKTNLLHLHCFAWLSSPSHPHRLIYCNHLLYNKPWCNRCQKHSGMRQTWSLIYARQEKRESKTIFWLAKSNYGHLLFKGALCNI